MKILGLDTSTKFLCLGLADDRRFYSYNIDLDRRHSTLLAPTLKRVLEALGWSVGDIDYFACGLGPGSFTGLRVGLATIKGLSWSCRKPLIGIPTLDILAKNIKETNRYIVPCVDAKRNLIYSSIYKTRQGALKRLSRYALFTKEEFIQKAPPNCVVLGDAVGLFKDFFFNHIPGVKILDKDYWYPKTHNILLLALERIKKKEFRDVLRIKPIYLYPKECQIRK